MSNKTLDALLKKAAKHVMTAQEVYEQKVSWIYGELGIEGRNVSKRQVRAILKLQGIHPPCHAKSPTRRRK